MGQDYYSILNIQRNTRDADIKKAYRMLALKLHPLKNSADPNAYEKFSLISEAYEVLVDPSKRAVYDQFGEEGLKIGIPHGSIEAGAWTKGFSYHGNPDKTFINFFGADNPFQEFYDRVDGDMHLSFGGLYGRSQIQQNAPIERDLHLTLEEIYHGCVKKLKISRRVMNDDGHTSSIRDKILSVNVQSGWKQGTRITFPKEGDQGPNIIPADVVFILNERPHPRFKRVDDNLIFMADISLTDALIGCTIDVVTLDDRLLHVPITDILYPGYVKIVTSEGMPKPSTPDVKGDLHIHFNIEFPKKLSPEQKEHIKVILQ